MSIRAGYFRSHFGTVSALALVLALSGCDSGEKTAGGGGAAQVIAEVNGAPITRKDPRRN